MRDTKSIARFIKKMGEFKINTAYGILKHIQ
jgi:hypothetical protein